MKSRGFSKAVIALGVAGACMFGMAACSSSDGGSGAVAATVNGTEISEQSVTDQIESIRAQSDLTDEDSWGTFLSQYAMTPSSVREQIIDSMADQILIKDGAADLEISVDASEIDEYVDTMKANYEDDEAWATALEQAGFTEESYREVIEESLYDQKISDHFSETAETSDEDLLAAAENYAMYFDGAKRSSHILFAVDDITDEAALNEAKAKAQEVLDQINAGSLDFADAAKQYSQDPGSAENGGDVGWNVTNSFVTEYADAVEGLEVGQVSDLVVSDFGVHIIKVTEEFTAPEEITSLDQIPADFQDTIREMAASIGANTAYSDWVQGLKDSAEIVVNDMPSGLPYDVDMSKYPAATEDGADADDEGEDAEGEGTEDEEAEGDEAEDGELVEVEGEGVTEGDEAEADEAGADEAGADEAGAENAEAASDEAASDEAASAGASQADTATAGSSGTASE